MLNLRSRKTLTSTAALAAAVLLLTVTLTHIGRAKPRPAAGQVSPPPDEVARDGVMQGSYATAINIHNPYVTTVTLFKLAVQAFPESYTLPAPSAFHAVTLTAGRALEVDCSDIRGLLSDTSDPFLKGFVTILAPTELDVVGVYSASPSLTITYAAPSPGLALEMLQVPQRVIFIPPPSAGDAVVAPRPFFEYSAKFLCGHAAVIPPP